VKAKHLVALLSVASLLPVVAGCGSTGGPALSRELVLQFTPEQKATLAAADATAYTIRRGDVLSVRDMFVTEINQEGVLVLPDGTATFQGLDQIPVEGLTLAQLDELLTSQYAREYRDPQVTVAIAELAADYIYVLGEVARPGRYELERGGFGVVNAIAQAGGFDKYAQMGAVVLIRVTPDGYLCRELDLKAMTNPSTFDPVMLDVRPLDVIYVTRTAIGDFAMFTDAVMGSLLKYSSFATDIRYIQVSSDWFRR